MSRIYVRGAGAVSPAGWGAGPLAAALLNRGGPLALQSLAVAGGRRQVPVRVVPAPLPRPPWLGHPRFRRASRISHFAVSAAIEALTGLPEDEAARSRLGVVAGTHAGSLRYSEQFFGDVVRDASTASPLLFPETVINAPASHVAAYLGLSGVSYSLVADQTAFVHALLLAAQWLADGRFDACLVLGFDELAWTLADALGQLAPGVVPAEGAGAVLLAREPGQGTCSAVELECITDFHAHAGAASRLPAAQGMCRQLPAGGPDDLLVDSRSGHVRLDGPEDEVWRDWSGPRVSPRRILGEALAGATAWQFVVAWHAIFRGVVASATLSVVGGNLHAVGVRLSRTPTS